MKTKVLIVPTLIVVSGFVSLQYLKPDFDTYMQKRIQRDASKESAAQAEAVANNVKALKEELTAQKAKVDFVKRYLPAEKDEARMFDSFNFLTTQNGLLASKIQVKKIEEAVDDQASQVFGTLGPETDPSLAMPSPPTIYGDTMPYSPPKVKEYSIELEALGGYSNIKELLKKLQEFDRLQDIQSFKIGIEQGVAPEGEEEPANTGTLTLTYNANLPYQATPAPVSGGALVAIPGFNQPTFDFTATDAVQAKGVTVPDMVLGSDGKANPFE
jgi:hypothetical protein